MIIPGQRLLPNSTGQTNPDQAALNPQIIQALINQQQQQNPLTSDPSDPRAPQVAPITTPQLSNQYQTPILDRLKDYLLNQNPPNPEDYKPSWGRRLAAGLAAINGGQAAAEAIQDSPYRKAMGAYDTRARQLESGANVEERQLTNQRAISQNTEMNRIREEGITNLDRARTAENAVREEQAATARKKENDIYETQQKKLEQALQMANDKLQQAKSESQRKEGDVNAQLALHARQIDVMTATHRLEMAQKDKQLDEIKNLHANLKQKWDDEQASRQAALDNKNGGNTGSTKTETVIGPDGKPTQSKVTTTQRGVQPAQGTIKVRDKKTGQTGTIGANKFDPALYDKVQ